MLQSPRLASTLTVLRCLPILLAGGAVASSGSEAPAAPSRLLDTGRGQVHVPAGPQRVVVLSPGLLDAAAALGVSPVAAVTGSTVPRLPNYLDFATAGPVAVLPGEPAARDVLAQEPDLVVGPDEPRLAGLYETLAADVPTAVLASPPPGDWRTELLDLGRVLGREAQVAGVVERVDARVAEVAASLPAGASVSVLRVLGEGVRLEPGPALLAELGLVPEPRSGPAPLAAATGDLLVVAVSSWSTLADPAPQLHTVTTDPAWASLPAVAGGRTCLAANLPAWSLPGPLATRVVADEIAGCFG